MSILFDGVDDFIDLGAGTLINDIWTVSTWFKMPDVSVNSFLFGLKPDVGNFNRIDIKITSSKIGCSVFNRFESQRKRFEGNTTLSNNTWYNYTASWNGAVGDVLDLYLQGVPDKPYNKIINGSGQVNDSVRNRKIGASGDGTSPFPGQITEVAVWNIVLTAAEILSLFNSKNKGKPLDVQIANLAGFWKMNDGNDGTSADGETIKDSSGNGVDGTGDNGANNTGLTWKAEEALTQSSLIHRKYW